MPEGLLPMEPNKNGAKEATRVKSAWAHMHLQCRSIAFKQYVDLNSFNSLHNTRERLIHKCFRKTFIFLLNDLFFFTCSLTASEVLYTIHMAIGLFRFALVGEWCEVLSERYICMHMCVSVCIAVCVLFGSSICALHQRTWNASHTKPYTHSH